MTAEAQVEAYISAVTASLGSATFSERETIAAEIAAYLRGADVQAGLSAEQVLEQLGTPEELAQKFQSLLPVSRAGHGYSPIALLRATFKTGATGVLIALAAMIGYWLAGAQIVFGVLGLFWELISTSINPAPSAPAAQHTVPILFVSAGAVLLATTVALQLWLRTYLRRHSPLPIQGK